jgi:hypothetical protein
LRAQGAEDANERHESTPRTTYWFRRRHTHIDARTQDLPDLRTLRLFQRGAPSDIELERETEVQIDHWIRN